MHGVILKESMSIGLLLTVCWTALVAPNSEDLQIISQEWYKSDHLSFNFQLSLAGLSLTAKHAKFWDKHNAVFTEGVQVACHERI